LIAIPAHPYQPHARTRAARQYGFGVQSLYALLNMQECIFATGFLASLLVYAANILSAKNSGVEKC
jgi:hypothetical protein